MARAEKGQRLVCEPCGKEVVVDMCGCAGNTVWCCNQPMVKKEKAKSARRK